MPPMTDIKARKGHEADFERSAKNLFDDQPSQTKGDKREKS